MATKAKTRDRRVSQSCAETPEGTVGTNPMTKRPNTDGRRISRHLALLKNEDVDRWHRNMRSGSEKMEPEGKALFALYILMLLFLAVLVFLLFRPLLPL